MQNSSYIPCDCLSLYAGVKFCCSNCGEEGHRRHYCSILRENSGPIRFRCSNCGGRGHNRRTCGRSKLDTETQEKSHNVLRHCKLCGQSGHDRRTCTEARYSSAESPLIVLSKRAYSCRFCLEKGHNRRTCPQRKGI